MDIDAVTAEVASAVALAEGPSGVADILRVIARHEPVAVREISRMSGLPVPVVAAACNELRKHGMVDRARPVRLTAAGRAEVAGTAGEAGGGGWCPCCGGRGVIVPAQAAEVTGELERLAAGMPAAKLDLDQTHCTVDTKLRRVARMWEEGALGGRRVIVLGDDDLMSLAITAFARAAGPGASPRRLTVVDCDPDLVGYLTARLRGPGGVVQAGTVEVIEHDLREPLPGRLTGAFDVACTDPPYTLAGARLFLSRAVSALAPGAGRHVFFSFGARRPDETLHTQRLIADMGLTVRCLLPGFNTYEGAGILAGTSHLYHLRSTTGSRPAIGGTHTGPLYTADARAVPSRPYRCTGCGAVHKVGPGDHWPSIAALKAAGCPRCGGSVLRPMALRARAPLAARP